MFIRQQILTFSGFDLYICGVIGLIITGLNYLGNRILYWNKI